MKAEKIDEMLEEVLRPEKEADSIVNQRIIMKVREIERTEKEFRMRGRRAKYMSSN